MANNLSKGSKEKIEHFQKRQVSGHPEADKGGLIVIMHRAAHDKESQRQLHNMSFHRNLNKKPTDGLRQCMSKLD